MLRIGGGFSLPVQKNQGNEAILLDFAAKVWYNTGQSESGPHDPVVPCNLPRLPPALLFHHMDGEPCS